MRKLVCIISALLFSFALSGCGDVTVNQPARRVIIEKKEDAPIVVEKTVVEKPVIVVKKTTVIEKH